MKNLLFENFNRLIVKDFWMVKIWPYFHKSIWVKNFDLFFNFFVSKNMFLKVLDGSIILKLCVFSFKDFQIKKWH
jgi:hypothetical protein